MKKILVPSLIALAISALAPVAHAQTAPAEAVSSLSFNAGVVSEYRYRGISQSRLEPALQGGVDYADKSGFYVGAWGSSIKWIKDAGEIAGTPSAKGPVELDLYGGYKFSVGDLAYDVGYLRYEYVGNKLADTGSYGNANTDEIYGAVTLGAYTAKYSYALSNLFGNLDSKGSYYLDLSATYDLGEGYSLVPHVGYQKLKGELNAAGTYTDYSLTLAKDLGNGLTATGALVGTDADKNFYYTPGKQGVEGLGKTGLVVGLKYTF